MPSLPAANKSDRISTSRSASSTSSSRLTSSPDSSSSISSSSSSSSTSSSTPQALVMAMMIADANDMVPIASEVGRPRPRPRRRRRRPQIPRTLPRGIICSSNPSKSEQFGTHMPTAHYPFVFNRLIMITLLLMSMVLLLLPHTVCAAPGYSRTVHVPIGSVLTLDIGVDGRTASPPSPQGFPGWARINESASQVYGIPQEKDVGVYTIPFQDRTVRIEVGNELKQRCEEEVKTIWLEILDQQRIDELPMENQFNSVKSLLAKLNVRLADVRLFPFNYLDTYRTVTEIIQELEQYQQHHPQGQQKIHGQQIVYSVNISCGELNEQSSEMISAAIENGLSFQVVQGILVNLHESVSTPATSITTKNSGEQQNRQAPAASSTNSTVPLIILALILAVLVLVSIFWILIKRAKAGQEKQSDANGKARPGTAQLPSPAGDSTTPMLGHKGNAERTTVDEMAQENGAAGRK